VIATSGQAKVAYDVTGGGHDGRPPMLLFHAGVTDRRSWGPLVEALGPDHSTIAFDRRGFGETRYQPEPHSHVNDALAVLDAAGAGSAPVAVVGASIGGQAALDLARGAPHTDHAELPQPERRLFEAIEAAEATGDLDAVNRLEARLWLDGPTAPEGRVSGVTRELFLAMNATALTAADPGPQVQGPAAWDRLTDVAAPTLVLVGDLDIVDCQTRAAVLAERIPAARLEVLPGTAHLPHLEAHPGCLAAITTYLSEI
jgi:pimeloyl-ACP methyl ester carboxylesterase